jgi:hypothetical protein
MSASDRVSTRLKSVCPLSRNRTESAVDQRPAGRQHGHLRLLPQPDAHVEGVCGRELRAKGFDADVRHTAQMDVYDGVPVLRDGCFPPISS